MVVTHWTAHNGGKVATNACICVLMSLTPFVAYIDHSAVSLLFILSNLYELFADVPALRLRSKTDPFKKDCSIQGDVQRKERGIHAHHALVLLWSVCNLIFHTDPRSREECVAPPVAAVCLYRTCLYTHAVLRASHGNGEAKTRGSNIIKVAVTISGIIQFMVTSACALNCALSQDPLVKAISIAQEIFILGLIVSWAIDLSKKYGLICVSVAPNGVAILHPLWVPRCLNGAG